MAEFVNTLVDNPGYTNLCPDAETYLNMAIEHDAFIVVNGLAVKVAGRIAGTPLQQEQVQGGVLELGQWYGIDYGFYEPRADWHWTERIRDAFSAGHTTVTLPGTTKWFHYRPVHTREMSNLSLDHWNDLPKAIAESIARMQPGRATIAGFIPVSEYSRRATRAVRHDTLEEFFV